MNKIIVITRNLRIQSKPITIATTPPCISRFTLFAQGIQKSISKQWLYLICLTIKLCRSRFSLWSSPIHRVTYGVAKHCVPHSVYMFLSRYKCKRHTTNLSIDLILQNLLQHPFLDLYNQESNWRRKNRWILPEISMSLIKSQNENQGERGGWGSGERLATTTARIYFYMENKSNYRKIW